jgi:hypothetical protein
MEKIPPSTKEVSVWTSHTILELLLLGVTKRRPVSANWTNLPKTEIL